MPGRVKDFDTIALKGNFRLITGGTDGVVHISDPSKHSKKDIHEVKKVQINGREGRQISCLVRTYETERRITCKDIEVI